MKIIPISFLGVLGVQLAGVESVFRYCHPSVWVG